MIYSCKYPLSVALLFLAILSSCKEKVKEDQPASGQDQKTEGLPPLGNQELTTLYAKAEMVDMIFYDMPISVNQDQASRAKNTVLYVSPTGAVRNPSCKPLGRLSWLSGGTIYKEADIYAGQGCSYFVFMENNQPVAVNAMSETGVNFFNSIITQVQQQRNAQGANSGH